MSIIAMAVQLMHVLLGLCLVVFLASAYVCLVCKVKRWRIWATSTAAAMTVVVATGLGILLHVPSPPAPELFRAAFGFPPPDTVELLRSEYDEDVWGAPTIYLHLRADAATIDRILNETYSLGDAEHAIAVADPPTWWRPSAAAQLHHSYDHIRGHSIEQHRFFYDRATGEVWYEYVGCD